VSISESKPPFERKTITENGSRLIVRLFEVKSKGHVDYWQARYTFELKSGAKLHGVTLAKHKLLQDAEEDALRLARRQGWSFNLLDQK